MSLKCDTQFPTLGKINIFNQNTREPSAFSAICVIILSALLTYAWLTQISNKSIAVLYIVVTTITTSMLITSGILYGICTMVILNHICIFFAIFAGLQDSKAHIFAIEMAAIGAMQVVMISSHTYNAAWTDVSLSLLTCMRASFYICMALLKKNVPVGLVIIVNCTAIARACITLYIFLCLFNYSQCLALAITVFGIVLLVGCGIFCGILCVSSGTYKKRF